MTPRKTRGAFVRRVDSLRLVTAAAVFAGSSALLACNTPSLGANRLNNLLEPGARQTIHVTSEPAGARVYVNNRFVGTTPCTVVLKDGRVPDQSKRGVNKVDGRPPARKRKNAPLLMTAKLQGYEDGIAWPKPVRGQETKVHFELKKR